MKYLDILIKFIFNTIKNTFKLLMKTPQAVIEWSIIVMYIGFFGIGLYTVIQMIISAFS